MFMSNMLLTNFTSKINTGNVIIDSVISIIIFSIFVSMNNESIKHNVGRFIMNRINYKQKINKIKYTNYNNREKVASKAYRAIMYNITLNHNPTINSLSENPNYRYCYKSDTFDETNKTIYCVDQSEKFKVNDLIDGIVYVKNEDTEDNNGKEKSKKVYYMELHSSKLNLVQLKDFVDSAIKQYEKHLRDITLKSQLLVDVSWDTKEDTIDVTWNPWQSNVTFDNRFFTNKDYLVNSIKSFLKNHEEYKRKGLPYTLGFLLYGPPGTGKTGFIKALMNLTKRHAVSIKLCDDFKLESLKSIIIEDEIYTDLIIPQDERIIVLEDIDCMGDCVKKRSEIKSDEKSEDKDSLDLLLSESDSVDSEALGKKIKELKSVSTKKKSNYNNMSFLLNILDGIHECNGRIIVMTTNKPEVLDEALIRPGRIDHKVHFTNATGNDIKNIVEFYWDEKINEEFEQINFKYSHAEITNICRTTQTIDETINKIKSTKID